MIMLQILFPLLLKLYILIMHTHSITSAVLQLNPLPPAVYILRPYDSLDF